jgi:hypothetical protein
MVNKTVLGILLACVMLGSIISTALATDTLLATDFNEESWEKTIDFFDYARAYALLHGMPLPPSTWHAYMYMTYVNTNGLKMLYSGLANVTFGLGGYLTIPMQTFMMNYKTENHSRDVLTASTFLMLLAFNETAESSYSNSPDMYDNLWSSFSLGFNLAALFPNNTFPSLNSEASIIPLTHSSDNLHWSWGMRYTNLTAIWWKTDISPENHTYNNSRPVALATYDELTFTYNLTISPETHTATLTENHVIGRIRDLFHFWVASPLYNHYNSTGCYRYGEKISNETVYEFIQQNQIKMSIVNFQTVVMIDHETYSNSLSGQNVTDSDENVTDSSISTYADDGERIFDASFGTKQTYDLYNYTVDQTENTFATYNASARTCRIGGFAQNTELFGLHVGLMRFLPLLIAKMHSPMYDRAKEVIANMSLANYFYIVAYPTYGGYRVEHDPSFTAYMAAPATFPVGLGGVLVVGVVASVVAAVVVFVVRRRKPEQTLQPPAPPSVM